MQTLQDQVDSSTTAPAADDSTLPPSSRKVSSSAQAFVLESVQRVSREIVAAKAAWALANLAANNKENQDAIRSALFHMDCPCDHAAVLACRTTVLPCMITVDCKLHGQTVLVSFSGSTLCSLHAAVNGRV